MRPKLSVVVPIYNVEKYLCKCVDSIISQEMQDFELILVNDGSSDNSEEIANEYSKQDNRIKVIHKENGGLSSARNTGINLAKGEYVCFIDSDDWIKENTFSLLVQILNENPNIDIIAFKACLLKEGKPLRKYNNSGNISTIEFDKINIGRFYDNFFRNYGYSACNKVYRLDIIKKNNIRFLENQEIGSEDIPFNHQVMIKSNCICTIDQALYMQVSNEGTISRRLRPNLVNKYMNCVQVIIDYSKDSRLFYELEHYFPLLTYNLFMDALFNKYKYGNHPNLIQEFKEVKKYSFFKTHNSLILTGNTSVKKSFGLRIFCFLLHSNVYYLCELLLKRKFMVTGVNSEN
jgi:glycosyltransferase involved in cell wall biosynthesis